MRRRLFLASALATFALPAGAQDDPRNADVLPLSAEQINRLLAGNTITGTWSGAGYRQYFAQGGMTMYIPDDGRADQGRWRVNTQTSQYESWWQMSDWSGYTVVMTNNGYAWAKGTILEPFTVAPGKQVTW